MPRQLGSLCIGIRGCDGSLSGWDARSGPKRMVGPLREARDKADRPKGPVPPLILQTEAQCGVCFAVLLGIVGSTTASDAPNLPTEASIRIGPKQRNRECLRRGSVARSAAIPRFAFAVPLAASGDDAASTQRIA